MFEILTTIIFVVVRARLTSNDYEWLGMTTNDYEKWIRRQSWPELPICERGIRNLQEDEIGIDHHVEAEMTRLRNDKQLQLYYITSVQISSRIT